MSIQPAESQPHTHAAHPRTRGDGAPFERLASWLSLACAVHCLVMPIALAALPLLGASALQLDADVDHVLSVLVAVSAVAGTAWGYRRHRDMRFVLATAAGLTLYLAGHAMEPHWYGLVGAIGGALVLAASAFMSARLGHEVTHHQHDASCAH